jgi:molybdopterin adenylyltransferase
MERETMGVLKGICVSKKRGTKKVEVAEAMLVENYGIEGDAHAGNWHRQVSLLSLEKIEAFREKGAQVSFGDFGENLIIDGFDFRSLPVGTIFTIGDAVLKMTQIGKECHTHCQIYQTMGECIMPREGVFAVVLKGGQIRNGDTVEMVPVPSDAPLTAAVITLSDKGSKGEREDKSGPVIVKMLEEAGYEIIESNILPDEQKLLENELIRLSDQRQVNLILTTGGTGFSERDRTPEATMTVATRLAPGIAEAIRAGSMKITKRAMLSRETSVIRNKTLIVNLPGSPKAVAESLELVIDQLDHGIKILLGRTGECARN